MDNKKETLVPRTEYRTEHAKHDPAHCLAPGLFKSLKRGERRYGLDITYQFGENETVRFMGFQTLGVEDLRFLQAIVALAGPDGLLLTPEPKTPIGQQLRLWMECEFDAAEQDAMIVKESLGTLLGEVGLAHTGPNVAALKASLIRMGQVSVHITDGRRASGGSGFGLLKYSYEEGKNGRVAIALNPRLTEAILGQRRYTRIEMSETRALRGDPATLIHQRLCAWIDPGRTARVDLATLVSYVYPDQGGAVTPAAIRKRVERVRKALEELAGLPGWKIREYIKHRYEIFRPAVLNGNGLTPPELGR